MDSMVLMSPEYRQLLMSRLLRISFGSITHPRNKMNVKIRLFWLLFVCLFICFKKTSHPIEVAETIQYLRKGIKWELMACFVICFCFVMLFNSSTPLSRIKASYYVTSLCSRLCLKKNCSPRSLTFYSFK